MRTFSLTTFFLSAALGVTADFSLSYYAGNIPSCADAALKAAMAQEGCSTTTIDANDFNCICSHMGAIAVEVARQVTSDCSADFADAIGGFCGLWLIDFSSASGFAAATSIVAADLAGSGESAATTASEAGSTPTTVTAIATSAGSLATAAASSMTKNAAAAGTASPGMGLFGAAAMAALVL